MAALHLPAPAAGRGHGYVLRPGELQQTVGEWRWDVLHSVERASPPAAANAPDMASGDTLGAAEIVAKRPERRETRPAPNW